MTYSERLKEFESIPNLNKFSQRSKLEFSDGKLTYTFYIKHKDEILKSNDKICLSIKRQLDEHMEMLEKNKKERKERSIKLASIGDIRDIKVKEMALCEDPRKFDLESDIKFKNGESMPHFFFLNIRLIYAYSKPYYIMLQNQYNEVLSDKKRKKNNEYQLLKIIFSKKEGLDKFVLSTNFFYRGTHMPSWFYLVKDEIFKGTSQIDQKIIADYKEFRRQFNRYKREFFNEPNLLKFDENSNITFADGILMYDWWCDNEREISKSNSYYEKEIMKQNSSYLKTKGE